jgi:hypothetical protein
MTKLEELKAAAEVLYKAADAACIWVFHTLLLTITLAIYLLVPLAIFVMPAIL